MRLLGLTVSAAGHAALLLAGFVLANARLMEAAPAETVAVDIVPENEIAPPPKEAPRIELPRNEVPDESASRAGGETGQSDDATHEIVKASERKTAEKGANKDAEKPAQKPAEKPVQKPAD